MDVSVSETASATAPYRPMNTRPPAVDVEARSDGTIVLRSPYPLGGYERDIVRWLRRWSVDDPERCMLAMRGRDGAWQRIGYGEMRRQADAIGQALLNRGLAQGDIVAILAGNSLEHAAMMLGAATVGVTVAPISTAYAASDSDHAKLKHVVSILEPALVFAHSGREIESALRSLPLADCELVVVEQPVAVAARTSLFEELVATQPTQAVEDAYAAVSPDTVVKILFTSGSTGMPKGVINTQRMLCANQAMSDGVRLGGEDMPVTLSWLPWNHTMAGNAMFNRNLRLGGNYYIDNGRPLPGEYEKTIDNLREISPSSFSNVPAAYAMLADAMERDDSLRDTFFRNLGTMGYAAANMPGELWERLQTLAERATGMRIPVTSGYGSTETSPGLISLHWIAEGGGILGLPLPGAEIKLVPLADGRYEIRARGPNVTPGYYRNPDATAAAFDEEGFYKMGDAARFVDDNDAVKGLRFAGRVAEDFKLLTGTWVAAGPLRAAVIGAAMPLVRDGVITGADRAFLGLMAWPNVPACRDLLGSEAPGLSDRDVIRQPKVKQAVGAAIDRYNARSRGSSTRIARVVLLDEPPSVDANEITDKGYINQSAALLRRALDVRRLYAEVPDEDVIVLAR